MPVYMVERNLMGISKEELAAAQNKAIAKANEISGGGTTVRYIRSIFSPIDGRCICLFEAGDLETVRRLNEEAMLPHLSITQALVFAPSQR